jgi:hypothetical protein
VSGHYSPLVLTKQILPHIISRQEQFFLIRPNLILMIKITVSCSLKAMDETGFSFKKGFRTKETTGMRGKILAG